MDKKRKFLSYNSITAGLATVLFATVLGLMHNYWFDLNDDVLMKDILAGVFTGTPEGHNIQMLYPISLVLSLIYRVFRGIDCYGIYLVLCQYISLFVLAEFAAGALSDVVLSKFASSKPDKMRILVRILCALPVFAVFAALLWGHLVIVQYTFTVAMLCAAGAVLFAEKKDAAGIAAFIIAFLTRSEMALLMLPFVLLIIFYRASDEFTGREDMLSVSDDAKTGKAALKRTVLAVAIIFAGIIISEVLHFAGYSSKGWREFNSFFNSRTDIYDFYQIPDYDENRDFYNSIELDRSEYELLVNYNFGLDDEINAEKMALIAEYAKSIKTERPLAERLLGTVPDYLYRLRNPRTPVSYEYPMTDAPWNVIAGLMYIIVLLLFCMQRGGFLQGLWRLVLLFGGRTLLWMYILVRGRDPIRITHSLYLMEIVVLMVLAAAELKRIAQDGERKGVFFGLCLAVLLAASIFYIPSQVRITGAECEGRLLYNEAYEALENYCRDHKDSFYFVDVYTSVAYADTGYTYSQKMFGDVDNTAVNMTLMGGWASKSPAEKDKLRKFGYEILMGEAVLTENAYIVTDKDADTQWIIDYYGDKGIKVTVDNTDTVAGEFSILKVTANP